MNELSLHALHQELGARFANVNGMEVVEHYGDPSAEYTALRQSAGIIDLGCRGRLCLRGVDRQRLLHGQVTNNVKDLEVGEGCYAALVTAKGKMQSDLNIYCLPEEFLLDFEPGFSAAIGQRFEKYIIADDVQVIDIGSHYGLLSVQGPKAGSVIQNLEMDLKLPAQLLSFSSTKDLTLGEIYCMNQPRGQTLGFDLFVPSAALRAVADKLMLAVKAPMFKEPAAEQAVTRNLASPRRSGFEES